MREFSYLRHRLPPAIIHHAVWPYFGFPPGYRDIEDLLAERGIDVRYETVRRRALKFRSAYSRKLTPLRPHSAVAGQTPLEAYGPSGPWI